MRDRGRDRLMLTTQRGRETERMRESKRKRQKERARTRARAQERNWNRESQILVVRADLEELTFQVNDTTVEERPMESERVKEKVNESERDRGSACVQERGMTRAEYKSRRPR